MITLAQAMNFYPNQTLLHMTEKNKDGTPCRARVSGKVKTWKTKPGLFCVPVKYGLRTAFYLQNYNDNDDGAPMSDRFQSRNDFAWCTAELWPLESVLFAGVKP
jgi:hypothetical protein